MVLVCSVWRTLEEVRLFLALEVCIELGSQHFFCIKQYFKHFILSLTFLR